MGRKESPSYVASPVGVCGDARHKWRIRFTPKKVSFVPFILVMTEACCGNSFKKSDMLLNILCLPVLFKIILIYYVTLQFHDKDMHNTWIRNKVISNDGLVSC